MFQDISPTQKAYIYESQCMWDSLKASPKKKRFMLSTSIKNLRKLQQNVVPKTTRTSHEWKTTKRYEKNIKEEQAEL